MKKIIINIWLAVFCLATVVNAQVDRSKAPEPGPAPKIQIGDYESFELDNGLKVFVVENHKIPKVTLQLTLDRDPLMEHEKAGAIRLAGELWKAGTESRNKQQIDEAVDFIGANLQTYSTGMYASALSKHTETIMELMSDILLHPVFPQDELEKLKKQTLSALAAEKDEPDAIARNVKQVVNYGKDHPYGEVMTEETVKRVSVEDAKKYFETYMKPNKSYLVIVGDINVADSQKLVEKYFSQWQKGDVPEFDYKTPQAPAKPIVALVNKPGAVQSVIHVTYPVDLKPGSEDVIKASVMNTLLGGTFSSRLMQNLREDKAYTYGARSALSPDKWIGEFSAYAQVRTEVTDSAIVEFLNEMKEIRGVDVTQQELDRTISQVTGNFARSLESPQTVANFALNIERYDLPKDYYATYLQKVNQVTTQDVANMARKYIKPFSYNIVVVGNANEIADKLKPFGIVKYYTIYGDEYRPASAKIPVGLTADQVIDSYIEALGGKKKLQKVDDLTIQMESTFQDMDMDMVVKMKEPNKSLTVVKVNGAEMQKEVFDGKKAVTIARGQTMPKNEKQTQETAIKSYFWPELKYKENEVHTKLTGIEEVNGKQAYVIEVTLPTGSKSIHYFDKESGLKVREAQTVQAAQGEMLLETDMKNYKAVKGIKFPHTILVPVGPQKLEMNVSEIKINQGISDNDFNVQ